MDPSIAAAKISDLAAMGNERTALDRVDGIVSRVELYFENPAAKNVFGDSRGQWKSGPAMLLLQFSCEFRVRQVCNMETCAPCFECFLYFAVC